MKSLNIQDWIKNKMFIAGIHRGPHNSSVTLMKDNDVLFHLEGERLSNIKYDAWSIQVTNLFKKYTDHVDYIAVTGFWNLQTEDPYILYISKLSKTFNNAKVQIYNYDYNHHEIHAATAFYNSGFDSALCIVKDGIGSIHTITDEKNNLKDVYGRETMTSLIMSYPNHIELVEKHITTADPIPEGKHWMNDKFSYSDSLSEAMAFSLIASKLGFGEHDAGKVMGLAPYGKENKNIPKVYNDYRLNKKFVCFKKNEEGHMVQHCPLEFEDSFENKADVAYALQKGTQEHTAKQVIELINKTGQKNVCFSGGFFLNCVSNYNMLDLIPSDINVYVEPMCGDAGNSLGAAKYLYYSLTGSREIKEQNTIYYGPEYNYTEHDIKDEDKIFVNVEDVAKLLSERNIVAIYQKGSESGPRALGNRSILYDPRDPNGKDHVNVVKKRESFRPFAASVLTEKAKEWFDLKQLKDSKFMMFAVNVLEDKKSLIPAVTHIDGTCRIQTVDKDHNKTFYNLINEFYKITDIPMLFNTSFNLAGDAIVETLENAIWTLHNSEIDYLYLPELGVVIPNRKKYKCN